MFIIVPLFQNTVEVYRDSFLNILWMKAGYSCSVRYEILKALLMKISIIIDVILFQLVNSLDILKGCNAFIFRARQLDCLTQQIKALWSN
jgi:hypothetical protein